MLRHRPSFRPLRKDRSAAGGASSLFLCQCRPMPQRPGGGDCGDGKMALSIRNGKKTPKSKVLTSGEAWPAYACRRGQRHRAGVQISGRPLEARDPLPPLRRNDASIFGIGARDTGDFAKNADPAASPDGEGRDCAAYHSPSGAAEGRVRSDGLGASAVPGARRTAELGDRARCQGVTASEEEPAARRADNGPCYCFCLALFFAPALAGPGAGAGTAGVVGCANGIAVSDGARTCCSNWRSRATFCWCCCRVSAKAWPPVPSATK